MYIHHRGGAKIKVDAAKAQKRIEELLRASRERDDDSRLVTPSDQRRMADDGRAERKAAKVKP
jgi:hypothetical protein